jgi:hypothetical protein
MSIVRVGTTKQYADNWDNIFGGAGSRTATKKKPAKRAKPAKVSARKRSAQKKSSPKAARKPARKK